MNYQGPAMINTANLKASLKDLEEIRDTATAAIAPLRDLLAKLTNGGQVVGETPPDVVISANTPVRSREPQPATSHGDGEDEVLKPYADAPPYYEEALDWIHKKGSARFTIVGFHGYLDGKYGAEKVNRHSLRNPFRRLTDGGAIRVVRDASGRKPAIYEATPDFAKVKAGIEQRLDDDGLGIAD